MKDTYGNVLVAGDTDALIKDLKRGKGSQVLKSGTKAKTRRLVDGDPEVACRIKGVPLAIKAWFVAKIGAGPFAKKT